MLLLSLKGYYSYVIMTTVILILGIINAHKTFHKYIFCITEDIINNAFVVLIFFLRTKQYICNYINKSKKLLQRYDFFCSWYKFYYNTILINGICCRLLKYFKEF